MDHLSNWIEIPASDLSRARAFYEQVLGVELLGFEQAGLRYALFPSKNPYNCGALVEGEGYAPSRSGAVVYLDATGRLDELLERVTRAGGEVLLPRTFLSKEAGEVAFFLDSEGNRVGLQAAVAEESGAPIGDETMQRLLGGAERGLAFVVKRGPAYADPAREHLQWEHARHLFGLLKAGKLRAVSALFEGSDVLGFGLLNTSDRAEAERWLEADPGVRGGRLRVELMVDVTFSAGSVRF